MKEKQNNVAKSHKNAIFLLNVLSSQTLGIAQTNITIALNKTWRFESLCSSERVCDAIIRAFSGSFTILNYFRVRAGFGLAFSGSGRVRA